MPTLSPFYPHPSTLTRLPDTGSPFSSFFISFFIPLINTVLYRFIQYLILLNDSDKDRKRRACVEATAMVGQEYYDAMILKARQTSAASCAVLMPSLAMSCFLSKVLECYSARDLV